MKKQRLIWVDIKENSKGVTPTFFFDFELLNELGYSDNEMFSFIEEMKTFAEKEAKERADKIGRTK